MRYGSLFSGIGGLDLGLELAGMNPGFHAEVDPYPRKVLEARWPGVPCFEDVKEVTANAVRGVGVQRIDILAGGFPCFPAGTVILTRDRGMVDIADVQEGEFVLTHRNRWRKVEKHHGSHMAPVITMKGHGHPRMRATANHPFWSRSTSTGWNNDRRCDEREFSDAEWCAAGEMVGRFWSSPSQFPRHGGIPAINIQGRELAITVDDDDLLWLAGRWVGDGWAKLTKRRGQTFICTGHHEADEFRGRLHAIGIHFTEAKEATTSRFIFSSKPLTRWLLQHFGEYAHDKSVPSWLLGLPSRQRAAFLDGYVSADGSFYDVRWKTSTVSKKLAFGVKLLAQSLGYSVAIHYSDRGPSVAEGRVVEQRPQWQVVAETSARSAKFIDGHLLQLVKGSTPEPGVQRVYNIQVEEDHSYVADGLVVRNCTDISLAGRRAGLAGERSGLFWEFVRVAEELSPRWLLVENVPGLLSSGGRRDMGAVVGALSELGYGVAWRVLDAQYFGLAQRRKRLFLVGHLGTPWSAPGRVLLDPESRGGDPPSREEAWAKVAAAGRTGAYCDGEDLSPAVTSKWHKGSAGPAGDEHQNLVLEAGVDGVPVSALTSHLGAGGPDDNHAHARHLVPYAIAENQRAEVRTAEIMTNLSGNGGKPGQGYPAIVDTRGQYSVHNGDTVAVGEQGLSVTLTGSKGAGYNVVDAPGLVRRLTPLECQRLQGFPDQWFDGTGLSKTRKYKAIGNAVAVPVAAWIARRIRAVESALAESDRSAP